MQINICFLPFYETFHFLLATIFSTKSKCACDMTFILINSILIKHKIEPYSMNFYEKFPKLEKKIRTKDDIKTTIFISCIKFSASICFRKYVCVSVLNSFILYRFDLICQCPAESESNKRRRRKTDREKRKEKKIKELFDDTMITVISHCYFTVISCLDVRLRIPLPMM